MTLYNDIIIIVVIIFHFYKDASNEKCQNGSSESFLRAEKNVAKDKNSKSKSKPKSKPNKTECNASVRSPPASRSSTSVPPILINFPVGDNGSLHGSTQLRQQQQDQPSFSDASVNMILTDANVEQNAATEALNAVTIPGKIHHCLRL